jgi:hypothetical protein
MLRHYAVVLVKLVLVMDAGMQLARPCMMHVIEYIHICMPSPCYNCIGIDMIHHVKLIGHNNAVWRGNKQVHS